jgi:hypothetical protein
VATSKKPPQVRELLGSSRQLGGDHFEHGKRIKEQGAGSQKGKIKNSLMRITLIKISPNQFAIISAIRVTIFSKFIFALGVK